jgi:tight adherence protein C
VLTISGAAFVVMCAVLLMGWAVFARPDMAVANTRRNLLHGLEPVDAAVRSAPRRRGSALVGMLTPRGTVDRLQRLLATAGHPVDWPLSRVVVAKLLLAAVVGGLGTLVLGAGLDPLRLLFVAALVALAYFVPDLLLYSRGLERQEAIKLQLADTLDQMTISVEAGLGFESAMARAAKNGKGALAEEISRALQDIAVGQPRRDAYLALADRTKAPDLGRFVRAVVQADAYGVSIADVLRTQAHELRLKRRQRAEEKAMQIPVKVIFPLILFILPTLFLIVMGPAVIDIVRTFNR